MRKRRKTPIAERYATKVKPGEPDECWPWTGAKERGYGRIIDENGSLGRQLRATRVGWEIHVGAIPDGLHVLHTCDHSWCHNPAHWFLGTQADNNADKLNKGRVPRWHFDKPNQKLDWDAVRAIRARFAAGGISKAELARHYGVTAACIWKVVTGTSWREKPAL